MLPTRCGQRWLVLAGHPCPLACAEAPPADGPPPEASAGDLPPPSCPGGRGGPASPAPPSSSIGGIPPNLGHFYAGCRGHPLLSGTSRWWAAAVATEAALTGPGEAGPRSPTCLHRQGSPAGGCRGPCCLISSPQPPSQVQGESGLHMYAQTNGIAAPPPAWCLLPGGSLKLRGFPHREATEPALRPGSWGL